MKGSTRKRGSTWTCYWSTTTASTGDRKQHSKGGFRTKKDAQDHLTSVLPKVKDGTFVAPQRMTLGNYLTEEWLPSKRSENHRSTTMAQYEVVALKWIVPHIGGLQLSAITAKDVEGLTNTLKAQGGRLQKNGLRRGLGERSVRRAQVVLKMALAHAVKNGYLARNPAATLKLPKVNRREMKWWTDEESENFVRYVTHVKTDDLRAAWQLFLGLAMRRGEVAGLRWSDLDIEDTTAKPQLRIVHTRVVGGDNKAISSTAKTDAGERHLDLDPGLVVALRAHRTRQREEKMANRPVWTDTGYVFVRPDGLPFHPDHFSARFDKLIAEANRDGITLPRIRLHDTRHSALTGMVNDGVPLKVVAEIAGHRDGGFTMSTYVHATANMGATAIANRSAKLGLGD